MALTLQKIREFSKELDYMQDLCKSFFSSRSAERQFNSADDKALQYSASQRLPDQYYFFRDFDVNIELTIDRRKWYMIRCLNYRPIDNLLRNSINDFNMYVACDNSVIDDYIKNNSDNVEKEVIDKLEFERFQIAVSVWRKFVIDYLTSKTRDVTTFDFR